MTTITFERFERASPANQQARQAGDNRRITYDWRVLIDGVPWATFQRNSWGAMGYTLFTRVGAVFRKTGPRYTGGSNSVEALKKDDFLRVVQDCLMANLIPSPEEQDRLRLIDQAENENARHDQRIEDIENRKRMAGPKLYEAAVEALKFLDAPADSERHWPVSRANLRSMLFEAVAEAQLGNDPDADRSEVEDRLRGAA